MSHPPSCKCVHIKLQVKQEAEKNKWQDRLPQYVSPELHSDLKVDVSRIIVPPTLRPEVLSILHAAHQGVSAMHERAKSIVF